MYATDSFPHILHIKIPQLCEQIFKKTIQKNKFIDFFLLENNAQNIISIQKFNNRWGHIRFWERNNPFLLILVSRNGNVTPFFPVRASKRWVVERIFSLMGNYFRRLSKAYDTKNTASQYLPLRPEDLRPEELLKEPPPLLSFFGRAVLVTLR